MVLNPRSADDIYDAIETSVTDSIDSLTNFIESSFNDAWVGAYADQVHDIEVRLLAAQLSGWVDYAGKSDFDADDLDNLGVDGVDPADLNEHMLDSHLDELATIVGIERDQGTTATGTITFEVSTDTVQIPEGFEVGTEPDPDDGSFKSYLVDADGDGEIDDASSATVSPSSGATTVDANVIAEEVGEEYNVGADSITFIPNPRPGLEGVSNGAETTGGSDVQSNADFRSEIKNAVFSTSGGGTAAGLVGYVEDNASTDVDVETDEFVNRTPPEVDVIVDGGSDSEIQTLIDEARPVGIQHHLVRPEVTGIGVRAELVGTDVDTTFVHDEIGEYLAELELDDEFRRSKLIQKILNADADIDDVGSLTSLLLDVSNESELYQSGTTVYELDFAPLGEVQAENRLFDDGTDVYRTAYPNVDASSVTLEAVVGGVRQELTRGTDYTVVDDSGDGNDDAIDFSAGGMNPDNRTVFTIEYEHTDWAISSTITDEDGTDYTQGTDWDLVDDNGDSLNDSIDWSIGGSSPSDGTRWFVDYEPKRDVTLDLTVSKREKVGDGGRVDVPRYDPL